MAPSQEKKSKDIVNDSAEPDKIDRNAPAGSEHSLGAQSVRDGRPVTDDSVVEAILKGIEDEMVGAVGSERDERLGHRQSGTAVGEADLDHHPRLVGEKKVTQRVSVALG